MLRMISLVAVAAIAVAPLFAQQQTAPADPAQSSVQADLQEILEEPATTDTYRYDPQGRRDPFRSLIGPSPRISRENAPPGPPGFMIDEIDLQGVFQTRQGLVAMVRGPDNNGYSMRVGDKVYDGEVIRITPASIVFRQEVNDPTRIERYREVVKELTTQGERRSS